MAKMKRLNIVFCLLLAANLVLIYWPTPALSQQNEATIQNLIVNGGFEGGFQPDFGVAYGWGAFSNGNAVVGWNFDDWSPLLAGGQYAQRIEIKESLEQDRYAGIYQTLSVVPGQQYKLTIKGLVRSAEGDVSLSDYGYRLQYAIDDKGGTAWELVESSLWQELPWDEQPITLTEGETYQLATFDTTITAKSDRLTLFIRGWKKWINQGAGVFTLDDLSFVGLAPSGFQSPVAPGDAAPTIVASTATGNVAPEIDAANFSAQNSGQTPAESKPAVAPAQQPVESVAQAAQPAAPAAPQVSVQAQSKPAALPVSGQGSDDVLNYVIFFSLAMLVVLIGSAVASTLKQRTLTD